MRVAIDMAHTRQSLAGIARFTVGLTRALRERGDTDVVELGNGPLVRRGGPAKKALTLRQDLFWYPFAGRRAAARAGADVYHCPSPRAPLSRGTPPLVVTIHDLVPLRFPETMTRWSRIYGRGTLNRVLDAADFITAPSSTVADDIQHLGVAASRIRVVPNGVDQFFFEPPDTEPALTGPYVLFVGTPEPRKNLARLQAAVGNFRARGYPHRLVVAGGGGWGNVETRSAHVVPLGRVTDAELRSLYAHAACVVVPSLYEGFGLPVLEAMAAGAPVVAARTGALPEIAGDAGVLVDPLDVDAIASGIEQAIAHHEQLAELGRARARVFTWSAAAAAAHSVYAELTG